YFDYMSYCRVVVNAGATPPEPNDWISPHNWQRLVDFHAPPQNLPADDRRTSAVAGTPLRVIPGVDGNGRAPILDLTPRRRSSGSPIPGGRYGVELENAAGHVLAKVPATTTVIHIDHQRPSLLLRATLPLASGAAAVVLTRDGREVARRVRSAHAPTAKLL